MPPSRTRAASMRAHWAATPDEQRQERTAAARRALAVKELVDQAPALTDEQRNRLRVILTQAPSGGGRDAA